MALDTAAPTTNDTNFQPNEAQVTKLSKEVLIDFTAGAVGGVCCSYVGQPMDTVKVKMQTFPNLYKNSIRCTIDILKNQGFARFYAGAVPAAAANVAETSVLFLCYGQCRKAVAYVSGTERSKMTLFQKACSGSFASFFAAFALCPFELVKCRMQTLREIKGTHQNITSFTIIKDVIKTDGPLGFYRGITSTILREVPGYFFLFGGYELTKHMLMKDSNETNPGPFVTVVSGGVGGISIWAAIYPFDVIKSRMQVSAEGIGFLETVKIVAKEEGISSFYKGIGPTLFRAFPACAALFLGFEFSKDILCSVTRNY